MSQDGEHPETFKRFVEHLRKIDQEQILPQKNSDKCYRCWDKTNLHLCKQCTYTIECLKTIEEIDFTTNWFLKELIITNYIFGEIKFQKECSQTRTQCHDCWFTELSERHRGYRDFCCKCLSHYFEDASRMYVVQKYLPGSTKSARKI